MNKISTLSLITIAFLSFSINVNSQSLLWEISGNGLEESSYLFGTVHLSDKRVFNFNDSVFAKIDECDAFTMEIEATPENTAAVGNSIYLENGQTIDKMLSVEEYAFLTKFFKETFDLNLDGLKIFTPMTIATMSTMKLYKSDMDTYVDNFLYEYAKSKNKKTFSVEPVQLQIDLLKNVPAEYLLDMANEWETYQGMTEKMVDAYAKEDMDALIEVMFSDGGFKKMEDAFIWNRNITMADSIDLFVNRQSTFIAIGTGHLPLEGGVIDLLRKKGYEVKPIIAPKTKELPKIEKEENWISFAPAETGFSIDMPGEPELREFDQASDIGNLKLKFYMVETPNDLENMAYGIAITDYPIEAINSDNMTKTELDEYYEKSLLGGANGVSGTPIKRGEIQFDSYIAKTMDVDAYNGAIKIRFAVLLRKNRLFLAQVISKASLENNHGLEKFLNSFKLIDYDLSKSSLASSSPKEWETLISEEGNFSIDMYGKPKMERNNKEGELPKMDDPIIYSTENIDSAGNSLIQYITYVDSPNAFHSDSMSSNELIEFYDQNLNDALANFTVKSTDKKIMDFDGYQIQRSKSLVTSEGIDVYINAIRLLSKNRFYYIQHVTTGTESTKEDINKFLNSFKILNK